MLRWVPEEARRKLWLAADESALGGHVGPEKLHAKLRKEFFWVGMLKDLKQWQKECVRCLCGNAKTRIVPPLYPKSASGPFDLLACDLVDMGQPTLIGNRYMLTIIDHFTKFGYAEALEIRLCGCFRSTVLDSKGLQNAEHVAL